MELNLPLPAQPRPAREIQPPCPRLRQMPVQTNNTSHMLRPVLNHRHTPQTIHRLWQAAEVLQHTRYRVQRIRIIAQVARREVAEHAADSFEGAASACVAGDAVFDGAQVAEVRACRLQAGAGVAVGCVADEDYFVVGEVEAPFREVAFLECPGIQVSSREATCEAGAWFTYHARLNQVDCAILRGAGWGSARNSSGPTVAHGVRRLLLVPGSPWEGSLPAAAMKVTCAKA